MSDIEELIHSEYPQLDQITYFDYENTAPISNSQKHRFHQMNSKILPSPHSSEEQSEFDRVSALFRAEIASLFNTNLVNYAVVFCASRESALNMIFEGISWDEASRYVIDPSFKVPTTNALQFPKKVNAKPSTLSQTGTKTSLLCLSSSPENIGKALDYQNRGVGNHMILLDATTTAPYDYVDLSAYHFDFVLLSMKKICGIELCPTLIRLETADHLKPLYYGGGAIAFSCARSMDFRSFQDHSKRLENGTPPLASIFASYEGLMLMKKISNLCNLKERIASICDEFCHQLDQFPSIQHNVTEFYSVKITIPDTDMKDLYLKLCDKKCFLSYVHDEQDFIVASFGVGSRNIDINNFIEVLHTVLN